MAEAWNKGIPHTEETRNRISQAMKMRHANDPDIAKRQSIKTKQFWDSHPDAVKKQSARIKELWDTNPEYRVMMIDRMRAYFKRHRRHRRRLHLKNLKRVTNV